MGNKSPNVPQCRDFPDIIRADPVLSFLRDKCRIGTPWRMGILFAVLLAARVLIIPLFSGYLLPRAGILSYCQTWPANLIAHFVMIPLIASVSMHQGKAIRQVFVRLRQRGVIVGSSADFTRWHQSLERLYSQRGLYCLLGCLVLGCYAARTIVVLSGKPPPSSWDYPTPMSGLPLQLVTFGFFLYVVFGMVARHAIATWGLVKLLRPPFQLKPRLFHPDQVWGLGPVGDFSMLGAKLAAAFALLLVLAGTITMLVLEPGILREGSVSITLVLYLIIAPASFIVPLLSAGCAMRSTGLEEALEDLQIAIAAEGDRICSVSRLAFCLPHARLQDLQRMAALGELAAMTRSLRGLPLNVGQLEKLVAYYLIPVLAAVVPEIIQRVLQG
jgi:hypothetical protein